LWSVAMAIGDRILECRRTKGISAELFARTLGVSKTAVWSWEKNRSVPRPATLAKAAAALGAEDKYLYGGENDSGRHVPINVANGHANPIDLTKAPTGRFDAAVSSEATTKVPANESHTCSTASLVQETRARIAEMIGIDANRVKLHIEFWSD